MNLTSFEKFKESEHYIVYLTKDRKDKKNKMKIKNKIIVPFPLALWLEDFFSDSYYFGFTFCSFYTI